MASTLTARNPFVDLAELRGRLDRVFDDLTDGARATRRLAVDVLDHDDHYLLRADVPGITPDEVKVELEDDVLTVSGSHEEKSEEKDGNYVRRERHFGSFTRSMRVPRGTDPSEIEAKISNGVLEVRIPKPPSAESEPKQIEVKAEGSE